MSMMSQISPQREITFMGQYQESLTLLERLHRLMLDVIKDEFERVGVLEINSVQALLLFNIGDNEVTAGELKSRGYYQGSNVSYNLKKLVEMGYMHHHRCEIDRRSVRVRLTEKGRNIQNVVKQLFARHAEGLEANRSLHTTVWTLSPRPCGAWSAIGPTKSGIFIDQTSCRRRPWFAALSTACGPWRVQNPRNQLPFRRTLLGRE